jgi:hypothetical protein
MADTCARLGENDPGPESEEWPSRVRFETCDQRAEGSRT